MTRDFHQCCILTSVDSNEPVQPPFKLMFGQWLNINRIFKRLAMALISLRVCAGSSEPLLVAHTTLLEMSCHGSFFINTVACVIPIQAMQFINFF